MRLIVGLNPKLPTEAKSFMKTDFFHAENWVRVKISEFSPRFYSRSPTIVHKNNSYAGEFREYGLFYKILNNFRTVEY